MTPEQFCYWMQGFVEITGQCPTEEQWIIIKDHIKLVFNKQTPEYNYYTTQPANPLFDYNRVTC